MNKQIFLLLLLVCAIKAHTQNISIELNKNWQFKKQGDTKWYKAQVPGTVHTDLLENKLIPDPFYRENVKKLQWIEKENWDYQNIFNVDDKTFAKKNIELVFDGLDTYADVYLNDKLILQADNMFRGWTVDVKNILRRTGNKLFIRFYSAQNKVDSIAKSKLPFVLPDNPRLYARKAQYNFGWDFAPKLTTCGIWKNVKLKGWDEVKIENVKFINERGKDIDVHIDFKFLDKTKKYFIEVLEVTSFDTYNLLAKQLIDGSKNTWNGILKPVSNKIWETGNTNGDSISDFEVIIYYAYNNHKAGWIDDKKIKFQRRDVQLIQQSDSIGRTFYFQINGKPVYVKGANWVPADVFLPRITKQKYRQLLLAAKNANMNMLRVWGGGVYEDDYFYDLCDSLGIMVWQDFMFAGQMMPGDEHFFNNVHEEVKYQIERLRNHPCIVLWCGNNEVDEAWHNWDWQQQFNLHGNDSAKVWNDYKRLFEDSLKKWVNEYDGTRPYISSSPKYGRGRDESITEGDSHYWGVWWGLEDIDVFEKKTGRFVSEYGMQSMPNISTTEKFTQPQDRYLYSPVLRSHQKHPTGFENLKYYLNKYFLDSNKVDKLNLEDYTYLTQCLQYYALKNIIAIHRSKYPINMGTLLWQLNDTWSGASWSILDHSGEPKAAWYAVREAYRDDVSPKKDLIYPKDLHLQKPTFKITKVSESGFTIKSDVLAKYVFLSEEGNSFNVSDNYFDLKPGEEKTLHISSRYFSEYDRTHIKIKSLYDVIK